MARVKVGTQYIERISDKINALGTKPTPHRRNDSQNRVYL